MPQAAAVNLRTAERFLLAPPLSADFASAKVAVCDISAKGARFRHENKMENGKKGILKMPVEGRQNPVTLEAVVVWTQTDTEEPGVYLSGVRTYSTPDVMDSFLSHLLTLRRSNRIEELRSADRFFLHPGLAGYFGEKAILVDDLSARGSRIETREKLPVGYNALLRFVIPDSNVEVAVGGVVVWSAVKAVNNPPRYHAGLMIGEKPELMRLAIGHLSEVGRAVLDTQSLRLKLKIMRARARQLATSYGDIESSGIPAEQFLLIQGVREELRLNPEEAMHWYRRARLIINDPATRALASPIADHPDALAVWEYLDRSIDPTIVGRAFEI
jgi:hypothetical protein